MIDISFIIPAYNVEKYIERCLNSIFSQNVDEGRYEVIVIDDGSTDHTLDLLRSMEKEHGNLRVYTQGNQGPSAARNRGLDMCKGNYVWFVDSDDYIAQGAIKDLLDYIDTNDVEAFHFTAKFVDLHHVVHEGDISCWLTNGIKDGKAVLKSDLLIGSSSIVLWKTNYLRSKNLRYNQSITWGEDSLFMYLAIAQASKIKFINQCFYIYERREGSLSTCNSVEKSRKQKIGDIEIASSLLEFSMTQENNDKELAMIVDNLAKKMILGIVWNLFRYRRRAGQNGVNSEVIKIMKGKGLYPLKGNFGSWKKNLLCIFLNRESFIL